jgi:DNA repair protein RecO
MLPEKTRAVVLKSSPFGETSAVVTLLTREHGKLRGLAKGAWRPKAGFDAALDLLSSCEVVILRKSSGGLHLVTEASLERRFRVVTLEAFHAALHLAEVAEGLTGEDDPQPEAFHAIHDAIRRLSGRPPPADGGGQPTEQVHATVLRTELRLLRLCGHGVSLSACASCGRPAASAGGRSAFGLVDGGALCDRCRRGRRSVVSISDACLRALRAADGESGIPTPILGEVRAVMNTLLSHALERRLRVAGLLSAPRNGSGPSISPSGRGRGAGPLALLLVAALGAGGCATLSTPKWPWAANDAAEQRIEGQLGADAGSEVISSDFVEAEPESLWEYFRGENMRRRFKKMIGQGPNEEIARRVLAEADDLFRSKRYADAIPKYKQAIDRWPDSSVEEDALFQLAECRFFLDQYPRAEDGYDELVKKFANTRYLDRIARRQFAIAEYWMKLDERNGYWTLVPNLADRSRPLFDTRGRAVKAFDHVRINDPRGPLADDSLMAQANIHFLHRQWLDADYYYGLLRTEYPDSDFLLQAHVLGLQSKLQAYQGPSYEGGVLDEAELLADQVLVQFPDQLDEAERERIMKARAEVAAQQALRHWNRAQFYERGKHYTSARIYYALIARDQPTTLLAGQAREKLGDLEGLDDVSDDPFPMLTRLINPDSLKEAELDAMAEADVVRTATADDTVVPGEAAVGR